MHCYARQVFSLTEWLVERGIGETRAILVDQQTILEAIIERDDNHVRAGAVLRGQLTHILVPGKRGIVRLEIGEDALLEPLPRAITQGASLNVQVIRESIPEKGRPRLPKVRATDADLQDSADIVTRLGDTGVPVRELMPTGVDWLEEAGWSDVLDAATTGEVAFNGGGLRISLTPAMTLIDIDGDLDAASLAVAGAVASAKAIRCFDIGGSIGIDLPTLGGKAERQAVAESFDLAMPQPFERTGVNGFGFMQIVRRKSRPSLAELLQGDPVTASALRLIRHAQRTPGSGQMTICAHVAVISRIKSQENWILSLSRQIGAELCLAEDVTQPISAGHVTRQYP